MKKNRKNDMQKRSKPSKNSFGGAQLTLYQFFVTDKDKEKLYSNTINLWDAVPWHCITRRTQTKLRKDGYLPTEEIGFTFFGKQMSVTIRPARLTTKDGKDIEYYPAEREELVEAALRKLAVTPGHGYYNGDRSGVAFTAHALRKLLKEGGHTLSYPQVVESLEILSGCQVEIRSLDGKLFYKTSALTSLTTVSQSEKKADPSSRWYADFSLLVTEGIRKGAHRQINYHQNVRLKGQLARYLHRRLSHNYTYAHVGKPFDLRLSTVIRDSGLLSNKRPKDNKKRLDEAFDRLREANILNFVSEEKVVRGDRDTLLDVHYKIWPTSEFAEEVKKANHRNNLEIEENAGKGN